MAIVESVRQKTTFNIKDRSKLSKADWRHYNDTMDGSRFGRLYGFNEFVGVLTRAHSDGILTADMTSVMSDNINLLLNNYVFLRNRIVSGENKYRFDVDDESDRNAYTVLDNITLSVDEIKDFINNSDYKNEVDIQTVLRRIDIIKEQINVDRQYLPEFKELQDREVRESLDRFLDLKYQYKKMSVFDRAFDNIRSSIKGEPTIKEQLYSERKEVIKNSARLFPSSDRLDNPIDYVEFIKSKDDSDDTFAKRRAV